MIRIAELKLPLSQVQYHPENHTEFHPTEKLTQLAAERLGVTTQAIASLQVYKRSFDARKAELLAVYIADVALVDESQEAALLQRFAGDSHVNPTPDQRWTPIGQAPADLAERPVVVGFGPCGMFAALVLAQMGFKPIVLERGKTVRERTKDTWRLWRKRELTPESNVQFGEGGAGTFSDGKLYSQIKDPRHLGRKVLTEFVTYGAPPEILYAAHPHIGTFKLVKLVEGMREEIRRLGGEIRFEHRVTDVQIEGEGEQRQLVGLQVLNQATGESYSLPTHHAVMALGHSSRDTFVAFYERGVAMEAKPFSVGFRIEHPQSVIDRARWGKDAGHPLLGAADYKLVHHAKNGRAVYSFCMCPGGTVVAATSEPERVVTNGMSQYSRAERNANAGMVCAIDPTDYPRDAKSFAWAFDGKTYGVEDLPEGALHPLSGIVLQRQLETKAYLLGGRNYNAPGQLVGDFIEGKESAALGEVQPSYKPGITLVNLHHALPTYAIEAMREALPAFGKKIRGYDMKDAVLTGVETRTSSPVKIGRGADFQSDNTRGLYPAGEGASYAGGILSAGVDGIKVGEAVACAILGVAVPSSGSRGSGGAL
ncbi:NAD(P)/FAD-dependent oxidoreductase [Comamonas resistens]|uniref:NAD(P)/FAD-dependent oxidoreductase n=1 Tax=Comamonas resistens TaxID=3046670 RepID=A0ABY8SP30_9BURK|nr:NAD(P)/FAD-dependent oxidoreductase [Comamonas resistens]MDL5036499.1 NAD(P)/FAD-dependent oxidoreductase [Comamonas resistens]WHS64840.1 NAD(P)/FAD-dependent oxidoreductase [Comamonas resistens]